MPVDRVEIAALALTQSTDTGVLVAVDTRALTVELVCHYKEGVPYNIIIEIA